MSDPDHAQPRAPVLRIETGTHTGRVWCMAVDAGGRHLVTGSTDGTARVWDLPAGALATTLRPSVKAGTIDQVAIAPGGGRVALSYASQVLDGDNSSVHLYDRTSGQIVTRVSLDLLPGQVGPGHLAFSPDGARLAVGLYGGIDLYDVATGARVARDDRPKNRDGNRIQIQCDFDKSGRLAVVSAAGIFLYDRALGLIAQWPGGPDGNDARWVAFSPDGTKIAAAFSADQGCSFFIDVLSGASLMPLYRADASALAAGIGRLDLLAWSPDGALLHAAGYWRTAQAEYAVVSWSEAGRGPAQVVPLSGAVSRVDGLAGLAEGSTLVLCGGRWTVLGPEGQMVAEQPRSTMMARSDAYSTEPPVRDEQKQADQIAFQVNAAGSRVRFPCEMGGKLPACFSLADRSLAPGPPADVTLQPPRWPGEASISWDDLPKYAGRMTMYFPLDTLAFAPDDSSVTIATFGGPLLLLGKPEDTGAGGWEASSDYTWAVNYSGDGQLVLTAADDGVLRWYRAADGEHLLSLFPHADRRRWVAWTPAGHYDASAEGEDLIGWHVDRGQDQAAEFVPAARFRDQFHRPDLVAQALGSKGGTAPGQTAPVQARVLSPADGAVVTGGEVAVRVWLRWRAGAPVTGVRVLIDEQPVQARDAPSAATAGDAAGPAAAGEETREFIVPIPSRDFQLSFLAQTAAGSGAPAAVRLQWAQRAAPTAVETERLRGAEVLEQKALILRSEGREAEALPLCERVLAIRESLLGPKAPEVAAALNLSGAIHEELDEFETAEVAYRRALAIQQELLGDKHADVATTLDGLGRIYHFLGDYAKAEAAYGRALAIRQELLGDKDPSVASSLYSLGLLYRDTGDYAKAESRLQQAVEIRRAVFEVRHQELASALSGLGVVYELMGAYDKAEPLMKEALAILEKELGPKDIVLTDSLECLAVLYHRMGEYAQAEHNYQRAIAIVEGAFGDQYSDLSGPVYALARLHVALGRQKEAVGEFSRSLDLREQLYRSVLTESRLAAVLYMDRRPASAMYSVPALLPGEPQARRLALTAALLLKGRSAEEGTRTAAAQLQALQTPQDLLDFEKLRSLRGQVAALYLSGSPESNYRQDLKDLQDQADALEAQLASRSAPFRALRPLAPDQLIARVAQALPADGVLIEIVQYEPHDFKATGAQDPWGPPRYLALVLFPDQRIEQVDLGPSDKLDDLAKQLLVALRQAAPSPEAAVPAAQALYGALLAPLRPLLAGRQRLYLSPDGQLSLVPLAALHDGKDFLLGQLQFTYLTSGRGLLRGALQAAAAEPVLVLADPAFKGWPPLPGTRGEAVAIQRLFPQARELLGADATREALLAARSPGILHVATHGSFLSDIDMGRLRGAAGRAVSIKADPQTLALPPNPLVRSALVLTPGPQGGDGLVTALEVSQMDLRGTELVVLSACETGLGEVKLGQGVYGLRSAFFLAGAQTLVTSLWKVPDQETQALMQGYYEKLAQGRGRAEALGEAAQEVRRGQGHPYYWAAFIVLGCDGPLAQGSARP